MKDIIGFEDYCVTEDGRVYSKLSNKFLKPYRSKKGYLSVTLVKSGKKFTRRVHRLVASTFIENSDPAKIEVNHIDLDKTNNAVSNLEWVTTKENVRHAIESGVFPFENLCRNSILTDNDIVFINKNYKLRDPEFGVRALGRRFGVCHKAIQKVLSRSGGR